MLFAAFMPDDVIFSLGSSTMGPLLVASIYVMGILYMLWRSWTFTVRPILWPKDPRELPYWIPILGHAISFVKDAQSLISYGKEYFQESSEPFAITVGGEKLYVVTSPTDVAAIYRNNTTLSWDAMLNDLLVAFGVNAKTIPKLWEKADRGPKSPDQTPLGLSIIHSTLDLYKRQLLPGKNLDKFSGSLLGYISGSLVWGSVSQRGVAMSKVSLKDFCADTLVDALTRTLFGERILDIEPELVQSLLDFNDDAWMLIFHYPQSAASKLMKARHKILEGFKKYMQGPDETRSDRAWLIEKTMRQQETLGIGDEDRAALLLMIYWAANINPYKLAFWMITYIVFDPKLLATLRAETSLAYRDDNLDLSHLMENCPRLDAMYSETLRVVNGALSARKIVAPTPMGSKVLDSGNTILIPFRQLHYNKYVFGDDPARFEPERFLKDPNLKNSSSFKPFGGGVNYCPGRFLAKQEMFVFVALLINRFDIELAEEGLQDGEITRPQTFPKLDEYTPALGVNGPVKGSDVYIKIRKREE